MLLTGWAIIQFLIRDKPANILEGIRFEVELHITVESNVQASHIFPSTEFLSFTSSGTHSYKRWIKILIENKIIQATFNNKPEHELNQQLSH